MSNVWTEIYLKHILEIARKHAARKEKTFAAEMLSSTPPSRTTASDEDECLPAQSCSNGSVSTTSMFLGSGGTASARRSGNGKESLSCPTPGCDGSGHVSRNYTNHRSLYCCPRADRSLILTEGLLPQKGCPTLGCDGSGHSRRNRTSHRTLYGCPRVKTKRLQFKDCLYKTCVPLVQQEPPRCPIPSCDGTGHTNGIYQSHHRVENCPVAASLLEDAGLSEEEISAAQNGDCLDDDESKAMLASIDNDIATLNKAKLVMERDMIKLRTELNVVEHKVSVFQSNVKVAQNKKVQYENYLQEAQPFLINALKGVKHPAFNGDEINNKNFHEVITKLTSLCLNQYSPEVRALDLAVRNTLAKCNMESISEPLSAQLDVEKPKTDEDEDEDGNSEAGKLLLPQDPDTAAVTGPAHR